MRQYSRLFRVSSALAPFCFGMIVAGLLSVHPGGPTSLPVDASFASIYLAPWFNGFGLLCGCFVATLLAYLASVFFRGRY